MKRLLCLLIAAVACASLSFALAQEPAVPKKVEPNPKTVDWKSGPIGVQPPLASGRRDLSFRQRRELGLTIANLAEIAKELKAEGEIDKDTPRSEVAVAIAIRLETKNPAAFKGAAAIDLDSIVAFIERILPLILKLIDLFAYMPLDALPISDLYAPRTIFNSHSLTLAA